MAQPTAYYRAKVYRILGLPHTPKVRMPHLFGPWVTDRKRAQNLVDVLNMEDPRNDTWLQEVRLERMAS